MREYPVMSLKETLKYEDEAKKEKVSEVARSSKGFLGQYKKNKTFNNFKNNIVPNGKINWEEKRNAFIDRHLEQYRRNPTPRRKLALQMWSYNPKF